MAHCVLWDLDGTLVDSREDLAAAGNVARAALGLPALPVATVAGFVGDGVGKLLERLLPGAAPAELARAHQAFSTHYAAHCADATRAYAGIPEVLKELAAAGCRQAVVTNKPESFSRRILAALGLDRWLTVVVGGDRWRKPAPEGIHDALRQLGGGAADAVMIGDHHTDLLAAAAAEIPAIWCAWGLGHPGEATGYRRCERPNELPGLLVYRS
jgi:phosphoglycolate phosphatase